MPAIQQGRLKVGTDCSGMEAPLQALNNLGVTVEHVFSCDIDEHAKKTIQENYPPLKWYKDLTKRDNERAPKVDLYVAGFPIRGNGGIPTPHPAQRIRRGIFGSNSYCNPPTLSGRIWLGNGVVHLAGSGWGTAWSTLRPFDVRTHPSKSRRAPGEHGLFLYSPYRQQRSGNSNHEWRVG